MLKKYIAYIKDNPKRYWFKARWFGWGWTPAKWQGWAVTLVYIVLVLAIGLSVDSDFNRPRDVLDPVFILTAILIVICVWKGEKPFWNWGGKNGQKSN